MLAAYPSHIERLQEVLDYVVQTSSAGVDPFDRAIWVLESRLDAFVREARDDVAVAQSDGHAGRLQASKETERLMSQARSVNGGMSDLDDLWTYFEQQKETP